MRDNPVQIMIAILVGAILGSNTFLYQCLIPLKIAKNITEKKLKSFAANIETSTVSYVGTVIGVTLGTTYLLNTILFSNIAFIIAYIGNVRVLTIIFLCLVLVASNLALYKGVKREFMAFKCVKKCCPKNKVKSYRMKNPSGVYYHH